VANAEAVFAAGTEAKQNMIKNLWPELYNALAGLTAGQNRTVYCALGSCPHTKPRPLAVGRITRMGHPGCRAHIAKLADRPGGWPLPAEENKREGER
jgi:hypothetical protein